MLKAGAMITYAENDLRQNLQKKIQRNSWDLTYEGLTNDHIPGIIAILRENPQVTDLSLACNNITASALGDLLRSTSGSALKPSVSVQQSAPQGSGGPLFLPDTAQKLGSNAAQPYLDGTQPRFTRGIIDLAVASTPVEQQAFAEKFIMLLKQVLMRHRSVHQHENLMIDSYQSMLQGPPKFELFLMVIKSLFENHGDLEVTKHIAREFDSKDPEVFTLHLREAAQKLMVTGMSSSVELTRMLKG